jgi:hypothetical protein
MQKPSQRGKRHAPQDPQSKKMFIIFNLLIGISEGLNGHHPGNKKVYAAYRKLWAETDKIRKA